MYNGRGQRLDVYKPVGATGRPIVIFVHGGAWTGGSKYHVLPYALHFAENNVAALAVDFRQGPDHPFPDSFNDLRDAVGYARTNAASLNGDPDKIVIAGVSSGATMAALVGLHDSVEVRAVIATGGTYDLPAMTHPVLREALSRYMGPVDWGYGSPIRLISRDDPAVLLQHGVWDTIIPPAQAGRMAAALRKQGVPYEYKPYLAGHELPTTHSNAYPTALDDMLEFTLAMTA